MTDAYLTPIFAVIPTFMVAGPAVILAALFPATFAGLALFWRRWAVLLAVLSLNSSIYFAHVWLRDPGDGAWWSSPQAIWVLLTCLAWAGALVAVVRIRSALRFQPADGTPPDRLVLATFAAMSLLGGGVVLHAVWHDSLLRWPWRESLPFVAAVWCGAVYLFGVRFLGSPAPNRPPRWTEPVMLVGLGAGCAVAAFGATPIVMPQVVWTFEATERGVIASTPLVDRDCVYVSVAHDTVSGQFGAVYCLDRSKGKLLWNFNREGKMKQILSSPALDSGRVYVGEGLHEDTDCGLYCLNAATGREIWRFPTTSHVESSPRVVDGCVYFGAGDDGVYCVDAVSGAQRWHFAGLHVDTTPCVVGGRLYAGSAHGGTEMFCLDAVTGQPAWRVSSDLPVTGPPVVANWEVIFGVGLGKLNRSAAQPAGALVCLDAATGARRWRYDVPDAVFGTPAISAVSVSFGSRDGRCYCLDRSGSLRWKCDLGSPVVASPVLFGPFLYAVSSSGPVACLDSQTGVIHWQFDLGKYAQCTPELLSSPALAFPTDGTNSTAHLFLGAGMSYSISSAAVVYCLKAPTGPK